MAIYRRRRPFVQAGCAGLSGRLACIPGPSVPHDQCEVMGPFQAPSLEAARAIVDRVMWNGTDDAAIETRASLAAYVARTGHAIWHAAHELFRTPVCHCAACANPNDPRHPWLRDSSRIALANGAAP